MADYEVTRLSQRLRAFAQVLLMKRYKPILIVILFVLEAFLFISPQFWDPNSPLPVAIALGLLYSIIDRTKIASAIVGFLSVTAAFVGGGPLWSVLHGQPVTALPLWILNGFLFWDLVSALASTVGATVSNLLLRRPHE